MLENFERLTHETLVKKGHENPRLHAKAVDKFVGFKIPKIEVKLLQKYRAYDRVSDDSNKKQHFKGTQVWIGLHPQALQTPYCDIYDAFAFLKDIPIEHVVDIGAGYGRVGLVLSVLYPKAKFTGYEVVKQRQLEGNRVFSKLGLLNSYIEHRDVLDPGFRLPQADVYFIYDFSEKEDVLLILKKLVQKIPGKKFYLIVRGERVDYLMKYKFKQIWKCCFKMRESDLKIYTSL